MLHEIDLSRTDLNLLVLFEVLFQEQHVGRAADRLSLSPSAVSHGLARLRRLLNDPLFLRTPKGVVPTERALSLSVPLAEALERVRSVLATAEPFDAATSTRRFVIGAPDGVSAVFLPTLLAQLRKYAPSINLSIRQLLPLPGETAPERAWRSALADLEARAMDLIVLPTDEIPVRFHRSKMYDEEFVLAMRPGHPFLVDGTLDLYCASQHLVVSQTGDAYGFVDELLARNGRTRRIALTVPTFIFALSILAETDLMSALPRKLVSMEATRFGLATMQAPIPLGSFRLNAVSPEAAMADAGLAWLFRLLTGIQIAG